MLRRRFLRLVVDIAAAAAASAVAAATTQSHSVIAVAARKFAFEPSEIRVPAGQDVTLAITANDFAHGFSMPDFGIRQDLVPGRTVEVKVRPVKAGRYLFVCDNFCGEGHDKMSGVLVVVQT